MKNLNKLVWILAMIMVVLSSCSEDEGDDDIKNDDDEVAKIAITIKDLTASSAVVTFPVLEDSHIYTIELFNAKGEAVDQEIVGTGLLPDDEVVDGVATLDAFTGLDASSDYTVKVKGTRNIAGEGGVMIAQDETSFTTLAQ
ncbi:fibronectin type III domain-containing protein [Labilibacter marinus]|uniref:hypothetical protein n=1 Tax=Labilibacter marinus TaxID=1477105 RepID=UPI00082CE375|nr:hypothetical protein [Labilibacter marinus]